MKFDWKRLTLVFLVGWAVSLPVHAGEVDEALRDRLAFLGFGPTTGSLDHVMLAAVSRFYHARDMAPLWVSKKGPTRRAVELAEVLRAADRDGLEPSDYDARAIDELITTRHPDQLAELEVRLSLELVELVSDLAFGRVVPSEPDPNQFVPAPGLDAERLLRDVTTAAHIAGFVARFAPAEAGYKRLKAALTAHRAIAAAGGWHSIRNSGPIMPGATDGRISALRQRLRQSDDYPLGKDEDLKDRYDESLVQAVRRFQYRHGLEQDGIVGPKTLAALNVPVHRRINQIELNMERLRWWQHDLDQRHVWVNLADFSLALIDHGQAVFDARVVVGDRYHPTPVFSDTISSIVVNPSWTVPRNIARNELLPKIKADPSYLVSRDFTLLSDWSDSAVELDPAIIDWTRVSARDFVFRLRQEAGPANPLGRFKFDFPNMFNVYIHDTPERSLFEKTVRGFSHGCIRVEHPEQLVALLLDGQPTGDQEKLRVALRSEESLVLPLTVSVPVHIAYLTAWVDNDDNVHFRDDIYGRDAILSQRLSGQLNIAGMGNEPAARACA